MPYLIPDDWDQTDWRCIKVFWPANSEKWQAVFLGLLSSLGRGRNWDAQSGSIQDAQEIGREIFNRTYPLAACVDDSENEQSGGLQGGGGLTVLSEEEMGQVVTDVYVDENSGELVVEFGPCCQERYTLAGLPSTDVPEEGDPDFPDPPPPSMTYTACGKANALYVVWKDIIDEFFDGVSAGRTPWGIKSIIENEHGIKMGVQYLNLYTEAAYLLAAGVASETETPAWMEEVLCKWSTVLDATADGLTDEQQTTLRDLCYSVAQRHFTILAFPITFNSMQSMWLYAYLVIGPNDRRALTTMAQDTGVECCPGEPSSYDWDYIFDFTESAQGWTADEGTYIPATGWEGIDDGFDGTKVKMSGDPADGILSGTLRLVEITYQHTNGNGDYGAEVFAFVLRKGSSTEAELITRAQVGADATAGFTRWEAAQPYAASLGEAMNARFWFQEKDNGRTDILVTQVRMAGDGQPPLQPPTD